MVNERITEQRNLLEASAGAGGEALQGMDCTSPRLRATPLLSLNAPQVSHSNGGVAIVVVLTARTPACTLFGTLSSDSGGRSAMVISACARVVNCVSLADGGMALSANRLGLIIASEPAAAFNRVLQCTICATDAPGWDSNAVNKHSESLVNAICTVFGGRLAANQSASTVADELCQQLLGMMPQDAWASILMQITFALLLPTVMGMDSLERAGPIVKSFSARLPQAIKGAQASTAFLQPDILAFVVDFFHHRSSTSTDTSIEILKAMQSGTTAMGDNSQWGSILAGIKAIIDAPPSGQESLSGHGNVAFKCRDNGYRAYADAVGQKVQNPDNYRSLFLALGHIVSGQVHISFPPVCVILLWFLLTTDYDGYLL